MGPRRQPSVRGPRRAPRASRRPSPLGPEPGPPSPRASPPALAPHPLVGLSRRPRQPLPLGPQRHRWMPSQRHPRPLGAVGRLGPPLGPLHPRLAALEAPMRRPRLRPPRPPSPLGLRPRHLSRPRPLLGLRPPPAAPRPLARRQWAACLGPLAQRPLRPRPPLEGSGSGQHPRRSPHSGPPPLPQPLGLRRRPPSRAHQPLAVSAAQCRQPGARDPPGGASPWAWAPPPPLRAAGGR